MLSKNQQLESKIKEKLNELTNLYKEFGINLIVAELTCIKCESQKEEFIPMESSGHLLTNFNQN